MGKGTLDFGNLGHVSQDEYERRMGASFGFAAAYDGEPRTPGYSDAWNDGYDRAVAIQTAPDFTALIAQAKQGRRPSSSILTVGSAGESNDFKLVAQRVPNPMQAAPVPSVGHGVSGDRQSPGETGRAVADDAAQLQPGISHGAHRSEVRHLDHCGIVAVFDLMNVLVRAFYATDRSAINGVRSMFETVAATVTALQPEWIIFAGDRGHAARSALWPDYKAHRDPHPPELVKQIKLARAAISAIGWPLIDVVDWEADDVLATMAKQLHDIAAGVVLVTSDKDALWSAAGGLRPVILTREASSEPTIVDPAPSEPTSSAADVESNREAARKVFDQAIAARIRHGRPAASGYHAGTLLRLAWDAGSNDEPFESIDLEAFDQFGRPLATAGLF